MAWKVEPHDNYMCDADAISVQIVDDEGNVVACNTDFYPTAITLEHAESIVSAVNEIAELREQLAIARAALVKIEAWADFPPTGKFWPNTDGSNTDSDRPMSYGACFGSNGERDYMRSVARQALT